MFFDHEHYEEHLLSVWSRNPEFAHRHSLPVSFSPCSPYVTLGHISLHSVCPEPPVSSVSRSSFSGMRLALCTGNYGPRSRCRGPNSQIRQWGQVPLPLLFCFAPEPCSYFVPVPYSQPAPAPYSQPVPAPYSPTTPGSILVLSRSWAASLWTILSAPGSPVPRPILPAPAPPVPRSVLPTPGLPVLRSVLPTPGPPAPRPALPTPGPPVPWPVSPASPLGGSVSSASPLGGADVPAGSWGRTCLRRLRHSRRLPEWRHLRRSHHPPEWRHLWCSCRHPEWRHLRHSCLPPEWRHRRHPCRCHEHSGRLPPEHRDSVCYGSCGRSRGHAP